MKIIFLGTPSFATGILDAICKAGHDIVAVVTIPDKPAGRGLQPRFSDVKKYALEHQLPVLQPENLKDATFIAQLQALEAELFVVVAFRMLPEVVFAMPPKGTFNVHASLLPNYRGAAPINRVIMNGETQTGVTTFFLNKGMDTGDIIDMAKVAIFSEDNAGDLHDRLMGEGGKLALKTIVAIEKGMATPKKQTDIGASCCLPAPKISKEDMHIDWTRSAQQIYDHIRGLSPAPAAHSFLKDNEGNLFVFKIFKAEICIEKATLPAGSIEVEMPKKIKIHAGDRKITLLEVQFQGKKRMKCNDFLQGFKINNFTKTMI